MSTVWTRESILDLLQRSDAAVVRAIKQLYARQTADEQETAGTRHANGRGFNHRDAPFLTSIAKALPRYNDRMTARQLAAARRLLGKYWRQLLEEIEAKGGVVDYRIRETANSPQDDDPIGLPEPAPAIVEDAGSQWGMF